ncbi:hypothetical protein JET14_20950 (plasmid) [Martelella lutilitoris]|uniref:Uncharacterized protein n=1 Tax=Martelella lutilitoris TaxID=2583532 RepID=A0A7T7HPD6_9HYPH|nr:hypothetical protein [Martelella lutilitoris]QQM32910.1 hypothetical protein JET14_20950 [Martelella lutilitoris]QRX65142.1 hypothetical protein JS578_12995 [Dysgonomonadaceae bacterium zrk40]
MSWKITLIMLGVSMFALGSSATGASAAPITIKGVNLKMSLVDQVAEFNRRGLVCYQETNSLNAPLRVLDGASSPADERVICIDAGDFKTHRAEIEQLLRSVPDYCENAIRTETEASNCLDARGDLFQATSPLMKAIISPDGRVSFECDFVKTCMFDLEQIVHVFQRQVLNKPFETLHSYPFKACAAGDDGDEVCIGGDGGILLRWSAGRVMNFN